MNSSMVVRRNDYRYCANKYDGFTANNKLTTINLCEKEVFY